MSRKYWSIFVSALLLGVATTASAFWLTRSPKRPALQTGQVAVQTRAENTRFRNLTLQPEALRVARRLGNRFGPASRATSIIVGALSMSGSQLPLTITRKQTATGEQVDIVVNDRRTTWSVAEGTKAASGDLNDAERLLAERLVMDSPEEFVLAQLRGASYFTIALNVRPGAATDGYDGPLWNVVRVTEPQQSSSPRSLSPARLYYINTKTDLPDRVEYELESRKIAVEFVEWSDQAGEKTPSWIKWSSGGQTLMEFRLTNVSHIQ